jgi:hypothetical protein
MKNNELHNFWRECCILVLDFFSSLGKLSPASTQLERVLADHCWNAWNRFINPNRTAPYGARMNKELGEL